MAFVRPLSKSKLVAFRQCAKRLWLEVHRPELRQDSATSLAAYRTGHEVGEIAQRLYDPQGLGEIIDFKKEGLAAALERTRSLLQSGRPIFEAGFAAEGALAFADVLLPDQTDGQAGWRMVEVKSSYTNYLSGTGMTLGENQQRRTNATSAFVANRFLVNERFAVTPIVRVEHIQHERINFLSDTRGGSSFTEFIPGVGATYQLSAQTQLYGGVHKGFSPPRVEDAINSSGQSIDLSAERSVNAEVGVRSSPMKDVAFDVAVFRNDFSNLVQVGSIAGGNTSYQEGKALFQGVEMAGQFDKLTKALEGNLYARVSWTWLPTAEQKSAFSSGAGAGAVGNRLPYAPETLLNLTLGYRAPTNWNARAEYVYVGRQYSDFDNTVTPAPNSNGQEGLIASYGIWNAVANYTIGKATFFVAAKNLTDETYIVDRTRGIQVGMPRTFQAGLKYAF